MMMRLQRYTGRLSPLPPHLLLRVTTVLSSLVLVSVQVAAQVPAKIPASQLFSNPRLSAPKLSADGKQFVFIYSEGDTQLILSRAVMGTNPIPLAKIDDPEIRLSWLGWANAERILISGQSRDRAAVGVRARVTRLFGVNHDGKDFGWLGQRWPRFGQDQLSVAYQDQILHWTPEDPDTVLIEYQPPYDRFPSVQRMNVHNGRIKTVQAAMHQVRSWHADHTGLIRAGESTENNQYQLWARVDGTSAYSKLIEHDYFEQGGTRFAGFHKNPTMIYVYAGHEGRNAIFEYDMVTKIRGALVFAHPGVDVAGIYRDPGPDRHVVGARVITDRPEIIFFDATAEEEHQALNRALQKQFDRPVFQEQVSISADGSRQILEVSSETQPPVYFFYDRNKKQLTHLLDQRPDIKTQQLASTKRVTYKARDGLSIPAYLTLPVGRDPKGLPSIVLVHGGPWARDWIGWNPEVQLLANRGFAVLQMNFRGSTGYGHAHLQAGYREWGQKIQDDITDGVKWLIAEGIADSDRIGITGASYGGYATLVGLVKTPELYRAGAAYASVTDIESLISDDKWYDWDVQWHNTMVGGGSTDQERLRESSPLHRVAEIRVPVLLGHGEDDQRVHVSQSQHMADALSTAGKKFEYIEFPDEVHGFLLEENRVRWYERLAAFFEENLAPRRQAAVN